MIPDFDSDNLYNNPPHVVLLGAGASLAAFPEGDKNGARLPLMKDFIDVLHLEPLLNKHNVQYDKQNFESFYNDLAVGQSNPELLIELENEIFKYFSDMKILDEPTLYDELLLSLRKNDIIATFNWDPFLVQAYIRNMGFVDMPNIVFLHGNVCIDYCVQHKQIRFINCDGCVENNLCRNDKGEFQPCNNVREPSKLLYPVGQKDYNKDHFIARQWEILDEYISKAYMFTIFGYSAPVTDIEAKSLMKRAWGNNMVRRFSAMHIINRSGEETAKDTWKEFSLCDTEHGQFQVMFSSSEDIRDSMLFNHPRRSCEALREATLQQNPQKENKVPKFQTLKELRWWMMPLIIEEYGF